MTSTDIKTQLVEQIQFHWDAHFAPRMKGVTDEEFFWEPVADVWTTHPATGDEAGYPDWEEDPDPVPFTTLSWRIAHLNQIFQQRWVNHFGDGDFSIDQVPIAATAEEGMNALSAAYEQWTTALLEMPESRLAEPSGPSEGPYSEYPFATLVLHVSREYIHHAAECCLIRDLYRQKESLG